MNSANKIQNLAAAELIVKKWQQEKLKIVFTNGCFDLIHLGHVDYLEKARNLGDKLVLGLNSDDSIRKIKGENRPITDETSRSRILASMQFIDLVVLFDEDTPFNLIQSLQPDILVKGNDYLAENIVGADIVNANGGQVKTVPLIKGYSTTQIINKILKS